MNPEPLTLAPTGDPRRFRAPDGRVVTPPPDWECLAPGDAGLTRRVKAAGPSWAVVELRGRKQFSRGLWAPAENIARARAALESERATPEYSLRRARDASRREKEQAGYVQDFEAEVVAFLGFAPQWADIAALLGRLVTAHATPVGSGTVARTERIPIERRAEAAVIAWMRHQTTAYDDLSIARVKGLRREVRRELAERSRKLLSLHRLPAQHGLAECPLCAALAPELFRAELQAHHA